MTLTWKMLVKLELRRLSLPVVEAVLSQLKQPTDAHSLSYSDFRARLASALEMYLLLLRDHYDLLLLESHSRSLNMELDEIIKRVVADMTRPP